VEKEYGKLSSAQLRQFVAFLPKLLSMLREMVDSHIASVPVTKFDEVMGAESATTVLPMSCLF